MKITRLDAFGLLAVLQALDGIQREGRFEPYTFTPAVVDKVVENVLLLQKLAAEAKAYEAEVMRLYTAREDPSSAQSLIQEWVAKEVDLPLHPITKAELDPARNPIPISFRVRLTRLDEPAPTA